MSRSGVLLAAVLLLGLTARASSAQDRPCSRPAARTAGGEIVLDRVGTAPCTLRFRPTGVVLRSDPAGARPDPGTRIVTDASGRFFSANTRFPGTIAVWAPDGSFLETFGRTGEGPGELSNRGALSLFMDAEGRLHVRDGGSGWSIFDANLQFIRRASAHRLSASMGATHVLDDGTILTSLPERGTHYFHISGSDGERMRSFGAIDQSELPAGGRGERDIAYAGGNRFWAAPPEGSSRGYVLEEWSTDGRLLRTIRRPVDWFTPGPRQADPRARPGSRVTMLHLDDTGLLLVLVSTPNERWRWIEDIRERRAVRDDFVDIRLEVIDTRANVLLASERYATQEFRRLFGGLFPGRSRGYRLTETADGLPQAEIIEYRLVRK